MRYLITILFFLCGCVNTKSVTVYTTGTRFMTCFKPNDSIYVNWPGYKILGASNDTNIGVHYFHWPTRCIDTDLCIYGDSSFIIDTTMQPYGTYTIHADTLSNEYKNFIQSERVKDPFWMYHQMSHPVMTNLFIDTTKRISIGYGVMEPVPPQSYQDKHQ